MTDLAPDIHPPPRDVYAWTRVEGHVIANRAADAICKCGWRAKVQGAKSEVEAHLRNAWPDLMPRLEGESIQSYCSRVEREHAALAERILELEVADMRPIHPGGEFPNVAEGELPAAEERRVVLEHLLEELRRKIGP